MRKSPCLLPTGWGTEIGSADLRIEFPKEIKLVKDILSLVIDDIVLECDILNDDKRDLERAMNKSGC